MYVGIVECSSVRQLIVFPESRHTCVFCGCFFNPFARILPLFMVVFTVTGGITEWCMNALDVMRKTKTDAAAYLKLPVQLSSWLQCCCGHQHFWISYSVLFLKGISQVYHYSCIIHCSRSICCPKWSIVAVSFWRSTQFTITPFIPYCTLRNCPTTQLTAHYRVNCCIGSSGLVRSRSNTV